MPAVSPRSTRTERVDLSSSGGRWLGRWRSRWAHVIDAEGDEVAAAQLRSGRRLRVLVVTDDATRECLAAVPDTSISGVRVARLLSMARLNNAKSRVRRSSCNLARMHHTCPGRSGGFGPVSLPLFHAGRFSPALDDGKLLSFMDDLPG